MIDRLKNIGPEKEKQMFKSEHMLA